MWQQLHIFIAPEQAEILEPFLIELGALSITYQDAEDEPIFEPDLDSTPLWQQSQLTALFAGDTDIQKILSQLQAEFPEYTQAARTEMLKDQDWERAWLDYFKPMQFGAHFWIVPSGYNPPDPDAVNLHLDPGLAFGTGTHPTTALCLQWLAQQELKGKTILDYGCGSGILAIAALKLGAKTVWAIDYDPQALIATLDNAKRNDIDLRQLHTGQNADLPENYQADIVVANILTKPLIKLAPILTQHCDKQGELVLSGILAEQTVDIIATYHRHFSIEAPEQIEGWVRLVGQKRAQP